MHPLVRAIRAYKKSDRFNRLSWTYVFQKKQYHYYISVRQPSADNSSSLGSKLISSNAPTYDFYLRELLRSELTYLPLLLQVFTITIRHDQRTHLE